MIEYINFDVYLKSAKVSKFANAKYRGWQTNLEEKKNQSRLSVHYFFLFIFLINACNTSLKSFVVFFHNLYYHNKLCSKSDANNYKM